MSMNKHAHFVMSRNALRLFVQDWWPSLLPLFLFCIPPYTSSGYAPMEAGRVNTYLLTHTIKSAFQWLYPLLKVIPIILALSILLWGNKMARLLSLYAALSYVLIAFLQSVSFTPEYGLGICTGHLAISLCVAAAWLGEAKSPRNDLSRKPPLWKYWVVAPALLAFWGPTNPVTGLPDFNLTYLLTSGALAFCAMTPFYLSVLTLCYPRVNLTILKMTCAVGVAYGLGNMGIGVLYHPNDSWWWWLGVMHLPLLTLAIYGLLLEIQWTKGAWKHSAMA